MEFAWPPLTPTIHGDAPYQCLENVTLIRVLEPAASDGAFCREQPRLPDRLPTRQAGGPGRNRGDCTGAGRPDETVPPEAVAGAAPDAGLSTTSSRRGTVVHRTIGCHCPTGRLRLGEGRKHVEIGRGTKKPSLGRALHPPSRWMAALIQAGSTGLEPAASGVTGRRYNQLNYDPMRSPCSTDPCEASLAIRKPTVYHGPAPCQSTHAAL